MSNQEPGNESGQKPKQPNKNNEFMDDLKEMMKTKDFSKVNEKYVKPINENFVKPAYEVSKKAAIQGWDFLKENTPKAIAFGKETWSKTNDMIQKMSKQGDKKTKSDSDKNPPPPPPTNPPTEPPSEPPKPPTQPRG